MANTCIFDIKVIGERRHTVRKLFDRAAVETDDGCVWNLNTFELVLFCDRDFGDGITVEKDAIIIKGESNWSPPLSFVLKLSEAHSGSTFEVSGNDLTNLRYQRWRFQNGHGSLLDCIKGASFESDECDEYEETVFMFNGIQLLLLPSWVPVEARYRAMPPGWIDPLENTYEA